MAGSEVSVEGRRVLVTGARGFIGRHLVHRLSMLGAQVHATTRRHLPEPGDPRARAARWWRLDLADGDATRALIGRIRPDVVIHLASRADGARRLDLVAPLLTDNLLTTVNVMTAAVGVPGCRVVLAGSAEERAADGGAQSPYAASKVAAATYAALFRTQFDLPVAVVRPAMVYGPDDPNRNRLVPYVIDSLLRGVAPELGSGRRRADWVHVDDVVDALVVASVADGAVGRTLDVGTGVLHTVRETVSMIADAVGPSVAPVFGARPDRVRETDLVVDPGPARDHLGWTARVGWEAGIAQTVAWHREALAAVRHSA